MRPSLLIDSLDHRTTAQLPTSAVATYFLRWPTARYARSAWLPASKRRLSGAAARVGNVPLSRAVASACDSRWLVRAREATAQLVGRGGRLLVYLVARLDHVGRLGVQALGHAHERVLQHLVHGAHEHELDLLADLLWDIDQVLLVLEGQDHCARARKVRGQDLALQAADGQDATTERDLAGHRHFLADRNAGERADHGQCHRDTRGRPVLWDRAGRHVDVQRVLFELLAVDAQLRSVGTDP